MKTLRYECPTPLFRNNFVEVESTWTPTEVMELALIGRWVDENPLSTLDRLPDLAVFRRKITAIRIAQYDGQFITDPKQITDDALSKIHPVPLLWLLQSMETAMKGQYRPSSSEDRPGFRLGFRRGKKPRKKR